MKCEEQRLALEAEEDKNKRVVEERAIMFMDPSKMGEIILGVNSWGHLG